jgi:hypothetical protein
MASSLDDLPLEIQYRIMLELPLVDLSRLCQSGHVYNSICESETFWRDKVRLDYPNTNKPFDLTWRDYYESLRFSKLIPICVGSIFGTPKDLSKCNNIGSIRIFDHDDIEEVFDKIWIMFEDRYGFKPSPEIIHLYDVDGKIITDNTLAFFREREASNYPNLSYFFLPLFENDYAKTGLPEPTTPAPEFYRTNMPEDRDSFFTYRSIGRPIWLLR